MNSFLFRAKLIAFSFLLMTFLSFSAMSQILKLPEDTATWHYEITDQNFPPVNYFSDYTIVGDTFYVGLHYIQVFGNWNGTTYLFRQDSTGRVYIRALDLNLFGCTDSSELLAYDFNLEFNDTIYIHNCIGDSIECIVSHSDSVLTNVGYRKRLSFSISDGILYCNTNDSMIWIESIGSKQDLFYSINFYQPGNVCLQDYSFISLDTPGQNIVILTGNSSLKDSKEWFYIDQDFFIHFTSIINDIVCYDLFGRMVYEEKPFKNLVAIKRELLANAVYLLNISSDKNSFVVKFINR